MNKYYITEVLYDRSVDINLKLSAQEDSEVSNAFLLLLSSEIQNSIILSFDNFSSIFSKSNELPSLCEALFKDMVSSIFKIKNAILVLNNDEFFSQFLNKKITINDAQFIINEDGKIICVSEVVRLKTKKISLNYNFASDELLNLFSELHDEHEKIFQRIVIASILQSFFDKQSHMDEFVSILKGELAKNFNYNKKLTSIEKLLLFDDEYKDYISLVELSRVGNISIKESIEKYSELKSDSLFSIVEKLEEKNLHADNFYFNKESKKIIEECFRIDLKETEDYDYYKLLELLLCNKKKKKLEKMNMSYARNLSNLNYQRLEEKIDKSKRKMFFLLESLGSGVFIEVEKIIFIAEKKEDKKDKEDRIISSTTHHSCLPLNIDAYKKNNISSVDNFLYKMFLKNIQVLFNIDCFEYLKSVKVCDMLKDNEFFITEYDKNKNEIILYFSKRELEQKQLLNLYARAIYNNYFHFVPQNNMVFVDLKRRLDTKNDITQEAIFSYGIEIYLLLKKGEFKKHLQRHLFGILSREEMYNEIFETVESSKLQIISNFASENGCLKLYNIHNVSILELFQLFSFYENFFTIIKKNDDDAKLKKYPFMFEENEKFNLCRMVNLEQIKVDKYNSELIKNAIRYKLENSFELKKIIENLQSAKNLEVLAFFINSCSESICDYDCSDVLNEIRQKDTYSVEDYLVFISFYLATLKENFLDIDITKIQKITKPELCLLLRDDAIKNNSISFSLYQFLLKISDDECLLLICKRVIFEIGFNEISENAIEKIISLLAKYIPVSDFEKVFDICNGNKDILIYFLKHKMLFRESQEYLPEAAASKYVDMLLLKFNTSEEQKTMDKVVNFLPHLKNEWCANHETFEDVYAVLIDKSPLMFERMLSLCLEEIEALVKGKHLVQTNIRQHISIVAKYRLEEILQILKRCSSDVCHFQQLPLFVIDKYLTYLIDNKKLCEFIQNVREISVLKEVSVLVSSKKTKSEAKRQIAECCHKKRDIVSELVNNKISEISVSKVKLTEILEELLKNSFVINGSILKNSVIEICDILLYNSYGLKDIVINKKAAEQNFIESLIERKKNIIFDIISQDTILEDEKEAQAAIKNTIIAPLLILSKSFKNELFIKTQNTQNTQRTLI